MCVSDVVSYSTAITQIMPHNELNITSFIQSVSPRHLLERIHGEGVTICLIVQRITSEVRRPLVRVTFGKGIKVTFYKG